MPLYPTWQQISLWLALACIASFIIGLNRDEHGHPAGIRTTMLVCLAATLAMLQVNLDATAKTGMVQLTAQDQVQFISQDYTRGKNEARGEHSI
jgi:uncharacterized membrane protein YhiD involved in acid resistance